MMTAWCDASHFRAGLMCNQEVSKPVNLSRPYVMVSVCNRPECIQKAADYVRHETSERPTFWPDESLHSRAGRGW